MRPGGSLAAGAAEFFMALKEYTEQTIQQLSSLEHIRKRSGMYIGRLGDGAEYNDGIYILLKEVLDNAVDEFISGYGKRVEVKVDEWSVTCRDYGRGIPLGKLRECVSQINTGGKFNDDEFQFSVGMNGVGTKAVNALSERFVARSVRDGRFAQVEYSRGELVSETGGETKERNGTLISFTPDPTIFKGYTFHPEHVERRMRLTAYLNSGLAIVLNDTTFRSEKGLLDLMNDEVQFEKLYTPFYYRDATLEFSFTHTNRFNEEYFSFVNGQFTDDGGTHLSAFKEALARGVNEFSPKSKFEADDIREGMVGAVAVRLKEPMFESQTKIRLGSKEVAPGVSMQQFVGDFLSVDLDNYLHKHPETAQVLQKKIVENEKERKAISGIQKKARETAKKVAVNNRKLRDCKIHFTDKHELAEQTMIFITEGLSAMGPITASRNAMTQAVFCLRGKPLNSYGLTKKVVYENEEFNLLQSALNIDEDMDNLRYNKVIIATDADVDGMHIRLLMTSFFVQFFPDLIRSGHLYILQTPLFRVRNKKENYYCYSDEERQQAIRRCGPTAEITRFKGLGEISPDEFKDLIGEQMRLDKVRLTKDDPISDLLEFYMGKNTYERQGFIIDNLRIEEDLVEDEAV